MLLLFLLVGFADDIKSAYRRVDRLKNGNALEESEQQMKRLHKPNSKYIEDYEIGESSGIHNPSSKGTMKLLQHSKSSSTNGNELINTKQTEECEIDESPITISSNDGSITPVQHSKSSVSKGKGPKEKPPAVTTLA